MNIGMVAACYKPVVNGVTQLLALYQQHLQAAGHQVTIFTLGRPEAADDEGVVRSPALPIAKTGYHFSIRHSRRAQALLRQMDVIHCHHLLMGLEFSRLYGRCPIVFTNHSRYDLFLSAYAPLARPAAAVIARRVWRRLVDLCDVVVAPSASLRSMLLALGVRPPVKLIENGIDLHPFLHPPPPLNRGQLGIAETATVAVFVGRLFPEKRILTLLDEFAAARRLAPDLHLLVVGDGPQARQLRRHAVSLGIYDRVAFTGAVRPAEVPRYLAAADLFATASMSEVHPLTVIEAMASGLPVAAVSSPGIVDIVRDQAWGFLARPHPGDLAAVIAALACDPQRRRHMGLAARAASRRYDISRTVESTLALYQRLLDGHES